MAHILVVDDEPVNRLLLLKRLEAEGHQVTQATDGLEALAAVEQRIPDMILLDVMMPRMDGFEVCRQLRARTATRGLPIVLVTTLTDREDRVRGLDAGADDFITKPFDATELTARVRSLLRLRYYQGLAAQRELLGAAIRDLADGIVVTSPDWKVELANRRARNLLGIAEGAEVGLDLSATLARFACSPALARLDLRQNGRLEIQRSDNQRMETDAPELILEAQFSPVLDPQGDPVYVTFVLRDVTEQRHADRLRTDFFTLTAHKLRTPLTILRGLVELFGDERASDMAAAMMQEFHGDLVSKLNELGDIVNDLLLRGRLDAFPAAPVDETTSVKDAAEAVAEMVESDGSRPLELTFVGDAWNTRMGSNDLVLVLRELVENAAKFCDRPTARLTLTATRASADAPLVVLLKDNGRGIPGELFDRVFEECYQIDEHATGNIPGLGLGLALVKRVVDAYGGCVEVSDSTPGAGSTFRLRLP